MNSPAIRPNWHFWLPHAIGGVVYLVIGAYSVGVYSARMTTMEKSIDNLSTQVQNLEEKVAYR